MYKKILYLSFVVIVLSGCLKDSKQLPDPPNCNYDVCSVKAPDDEIDKLKAYLTSKNITATQHCSGVFYSIEDFGTGTTPDICSFIVATYTGKLTSGYVFDQGQFQSPIQLGNLIKGWIATIPLIKQGGIIHLYIPPSLGYGSQDKTGNGGIIIIPANSILIFDIKLDSVL
ncbi:MAG TPA: FKBP-type peptidyl-prolyl cis-trans isomerase [Chitinophagaceae bacterium]|nr:FKBP-type peptidyl-prolyl cis-trans isomerase [Chitinophagaceae bacterium]